MNKCIFLGNLTRDPERHGAVVRFSLAVQDEFKKDTVHFLEFKAFKQTAEFVEKYFTKGKPMIVDCNAVHETWEQDGQKRSKVVFYVNRSSFVPGTKQATIDEVVNDTPASPPTKRVSKAKTAKPVEQEEYNSLTQDVPDEEIPF